MSALGFNRVPGGPRDLIQVIIAGAIAVARVAIFCVLFLRCVLTYLLTSLCEVVLCRIIAAQQPSRLLL